MHNGDILRPSMFELFCGPMKSGKSEALLARIQHLAIREKEMLIGFKPMADTRDPKISSRVYRFEQECTFIPTEAPGKIFDYVDAKHRAVVIDEISFFSTEVSDVVHELTFRGINVIAAGLDKDFAGRTFGGRDGVMSRLLAQADLVTKLVAVCEIPGCTIPATRTQRLIDGLPAHYGSPLVLIGDQEYQARCIRHHDVPGRPLKDLY